MATCLVTAGISFTCETLRNAAGGLKKRVYIGNIDGIDRTQADEGFTYDAQGFVTAIAFNSYGNLYEFIGTKNSHSTTSDAARGEGGNVNFPVSIELKLFDEKPLDKQTLEDLAYADVFVIVETASGQFEIFGKDLGLQVTAMSKNSGKTPEEDTSRTVTLEGAEPELEKIFFNTDYQTSLNTLNSYLP